MARGEGIKKINNLFEKYKKSLRAPQATVVKEFQGVVYELFGSEVGKHQCSYTPHSRTLVLTIGGPLKTEILLRKKEILTRLKEELGEKSSPKQIL